mgnify:CR=1 FL=1
MRVDEVQDDDRDDESRIGSPVIEFLLAFEIGNEVGEILRRSDLARLANGNLFERIPSGTAAIFGRRLELDDDLPHALAVTSCDAPVLRLDVVDDDALLPAAEQRRDDEANALAAASWRNDGKVLVRVIPQVKVLLVCENLLQRLVQPDIRIDGKRITSGIVSHGTREPVFQSLLLSLKLLLLIGVLRPLQVMF